MSARPADSLSESADDSVDIHGRDFAFDRYPTYAALRARCPVVHSDKYMQEFGGFWLLTRYADVKQAAIDWRTFTSNVAGVTAIPVITRRSEPALPSELDPPIHSRYRALVAPVFSARRVELLRAQVTAIAQSLLEAIMARGGGDLVADFAVPLSAQTLAAFTGLPPEDLTRWVAWIRRMFNVEQREDGAVATAELAANHDPDVFAEPDQCRLDRSPNPHLTFGAGVHLCLGAEVARLEMAVTLQQLAERLPEFRMDPRVQAEWKTRGDRRGFQRLPVIVAA